MSIVVELILLGFGAWVLGTTRIISGKEFATEYLSKENTNQMRGIMSIVIVLYHLVLEIGHGIVSKMYLHTGYLIVALFFFLSGYGLMFQFNRKGKQYIRQFWINKIVPLLLIYIVITGFYYYTEIFFGNELHLMDVFTRALRLAPIAINSWYIIELLVIYLLFIFAFEFFAENHICGICIACILLMLFNTYLAINKFNPLLYTCNLPFVLGLLWQEKKEACDIKFQDKKIVFIGVFIMGFTFVCFSALRIPIERMEMDFMVAILKSVTGICFCVAVVLFNTQVEFRSRIWRFLGGISLEIYLLHGLFMYIFRNDYSKWIKNDALYIILTLLLTISCSYVFHFATIKINYWCNKFRKGIYDNEKESCDIK